MGSNLYTSAIFFDTMQAMDSFPVILKVKISPKAHKNALVTFKNGVLNIKIAACPQKGEANAELIIYLSRLLDLSKSSIRIIKGELSPYKTLHIRGLNEKELFAKIFSHLEQQELPLIQE